MTRHRLIMTATASAMLLAASVYAANPPDTWDGLVKVKAKRLDIAYLQPGADFRIYTKVMLDPTEVAFHKNWRRAQTSTDRGLTGTISDRDVQEAIRKGVAASHDIFAEAWTKAGYAVVTDPGPDVLRIKTGIVNVWVNAPDKGSAARSHTFAPEAGEATFFVEARDSLTGALLGRAVDQSTVGDTSPNWRTSVSNRADFRELVEHWANDGVRGVNELKSLSPITP